MPRHGRQFRHAQSLLPRIRAAGLGVTAGRPAGQMDLRADRILSQRLAGPRPDRHGRARPRRARQFPCGSRLQSEQSRRPCRRLRAVAKGPRPDVERLPYPGRLFSRARCGHQYGLDDALSQLRPARGDLRRRAAGRSGGRQARPRPGSAAAAKPDPAIGATLRQPARHHLRQRPLRRGDGHGPGARRLGRLSDAAAPQQGSAANGAASASPIMSRSPPARRASAPRSPSSPKARSSW